MASKKVVSIAVALALAATSPLTGAIGLGELSSKAVLNKPLQIDIPIIAANYEDHYFKVELADRSQHDKVGIVYPSQLPRLYFETFQSETGPQLRVSSVQAVKEPIVNFLLKVQYEDSLVLKEITLFLDPIEYAIRPLAKEIIPTTVAKTDSNKPQPYRINSSNEDLTVTVASGQSLWRIARRWQVNGASITDKMEAIFTHNPTAFVSGNRDRLKLGAQLKLSNAHLVNIAAVPKTSRIDLSTTPESMDSTILAASSNTTQTSANVLKTEVAGIGAARASLLEKIVLEKQLREINAKIQSQLVVNRQLREALAKSEQGKLSFTAIPQSINTESATAEGRLAEAIEPEASIRNAPNLSSSLVNNFSQGDISRNNWLLIIGVTLAILLAHILWIFTRNKKIKNFSQALDKKFNKLSSKDNKQKQTGHSIKKIKIPVAQSTTAQIKYLNSAADFYIRCERFDLAKELINESLIQFSSEPKIIKAISKIRVSIFKQLDAHLHSNISSKAEDAIRPDPDMILDIIDEYELEEDETSEFQTLWDKKAS